MEHNLYPRGSEWGKWDLHIHTPESILNNGFGDDWDLYVKNLFKKAISYNIKAIGVTDYFTIEGYKKIKKEYLENETKLKSLFDDVEIEKIKRILILPNIEFRIKKLIVEKENSLTWNRKVNFHIIFSDRIAIEDIEENFLHRLDFENTALVGEPPQTSSLRRRNIESLGRSLKSEHEPFSRLNDFFVGIMNAAIDDNQILKILSANKNLFEGKYLLGIAYDEDLSRVSWDSSGHLERKNLLKKSHFMFSSNPGTIKFGIGKYHRNQKEFVDEFNSLKPCLWGSDAHTMETLFQPTLQRFTWIKSNPTFEGLTQVIFEPEQRVRIDENKPFEKTPYLVIDKMRFIDNSSNKLFSPSWIYLNQNLNVIIGGKSSGKSLLLFHLAKSIDNQQVLDKTSLLSAGNYDEFMIDNPFDFEVVWKDDTTNKLSIESDEPQNQITFVPQLYINHLAEEKGENHLKELIESILIQNDEYKNSKSDIDLRIHTAEAEIKLLIENLIQYKNEYYSLIRDKQSLGEPQKINAEIARITKEVDKLRNTAGFTEAENINYLKLIESDKHTDSKLADYGSAQKSVEEFSLYLYNLEPRILEAIEKKHTEFQSDGIDSYFNSKLYDNIRLLIKNAFENTDSLSKEYLSKMSEKIKKLESKSSNHKQYLKPFQQKIKNQKLLESLNQRLKTEKGKLIQIDQKEKEIKRILERARQNKSDILKNYKMIFDAYKALEEILQSNTYKNIDDELELQSTLIFDLEKFNNFTNLFDGRSRLNQVFTTTFNETNEFVFNKETHIGNINAMYDTIKNIEKKGLRVKSGYSEKDLYERLLANYFSIYYRIIYKGDNILKMSPGKRGVVLLELILHISNATHPILIDQPEDNLDNRTIYDELKQFVIDKKLERQILIVTHNANLVVSTDSENIIVANQSGQQVGKDKKEFTFEYVSGALENTFTNESEDGILFKYGIREHVCDILEGGKEAFKKREQKYGL